MRTLILFNYLFMVASAISWDDIQYLGPITCATCRIDEASILKTVEEHNELHKEGISLYELKTLNLSQFEEQSTGLSKSSEVDHSQDYNILATNHKLKSDPTFDWRKHNYVKPIKRQGKCLSGWAFGVAAAIETHYARKTGKLVSLSPQHLVDCAGEFHNNGCKGGYQEYAYAYIAKYGGIALADDYKYTGKDSNCKHDSSKSSVTIKGFTTIPAKDEKKMKEIITNFGPLTCSVSLNLNFFLYKQGIFDDANCASYRLSHTVTVVGYGKDHWIIKNSWGRTWGEKGYMRLGFNNICNIAEECSYPVL